jgi:thiol-disulfide isomerase/thioredoxin
MATYLAELFDPDRSLQRGKPFPDFEFAALAGGPPVTRAERAGRLYLLEFWATWCGPCVADMPNFHAAYAKIHGVGAVDPEDRLRRLAPVERPRVEFVFVSLDQSPDVVQEFRDEHWAMPWTHAFVGGDRRAEVTARFGLLRLPDRDPRRRRRHHRRGRQRPPGRAPPADPRARPRLGGTVT